MNTRASLQLGDEFLQSYARLFNDAFEGAGLERFVLGNHDRASLASQNQVGTGLPLDDVAKAAKGAGGLCAVHVAGQLHASATTGSCVKCSRMRRGRSAGSKKPFTASAIMTSSSAKESPCVVMPPFPGASSQRATNPPVSTHGSTLKVISIMARNIASATRSRQAWCGRKLRRVLGMGMLLILLLAPFGHAADLDSDGIPDEFENELLQRFAPVIRPDQLQTTPMKFRAIPVSASWFAREARLRYESHRGDLIFWSWELDNPTAEQVLIYLYSGNHRADADYLYLSFEDNQEAKWGYATHGPGSTWDDAISRQEGVYGRVWQPWRNQYPNLYSVQYFVLLTWNEPGDCFGGFSNEYRHDGDVVCVDFLIDATTWGNPTIINGVYHVHGKQVFVTRDALNFENGHPLVFLERGVNESWPNAGSDGEAGWPRMDGFSISGFVCGILDEECCVRQHQGNGQPYRTANIPNIGEAPWPAGVLPEDRQLYPMGSADSQLFLVYPGAWGYRGGPPRGPAYQSKIWRREFDGPWAAYGEFGGEDPLRPNLEPMSLVRPSYLVGTNSFFYDFLPVCDVRTSSTNPPLGLISKPHTNVVRGVQKVATYGVLRVGAGTYSETMTITKPIIIESAGGLVTIGQ